MKSKFGILILCLGCLLNCKAQQPENCNRKVNFKKLERILPEKFCMPDGYKVYSIIDTIDITDDKITDKIIEWERSKSRDGDTTFVSIYKQNNDSTFSFLVTLNNLYTQYFESNDLSYKVADPKLQKIKSMYIYPNYNRVEFTRNTIKVGFFLDAGGGADLYFVFDKIRQNWFLSKEVFWTGDGIRIPQTIDKERKPKYEMKITDFNMFKYMED